MAFIAVLLHNTASRCFQACLRHRESKVRAATAQVLKLWPSNLLCSPEMFLLKFWGAGLVTGFPGPWAASGQCPHMMMSVLVFHAADW
ncbi:hypothetical protein C0J52_10744 [Blattella germanica]|nr:hypothetical protein C0J52_10744 [Blattella germanica]